MKDSEGKFLIEAGKIMEFASAVHDADPVYASESAAQQRRLQPMPAPPTYSQAAALFGLGPEPAIPDLDMRFVLHGEQEFIFERPLMAGDVLTADHRFAGTVEKQGKRGGVMRLHTIETTFRDAAGSAVLVSRMVLVQTEGAVAR